MTNPHTATGRRWAYLGIALGGLVSVAANIAHSFVPPHDAPTGWHPQGGAVIGAIVWPVFLFIAIEILIANHWPAGIRYRLLRFGGLLPVALVAAYVSYRHLSGLLAHYGEEEVVYRLGPFAVDGLMVMATGALYAARHTNGPRQPEHDVEPFAEHVDEPGGRPTPAVATTPAQAEPDHPTGVPAHLIPTARFAVTNHEAVTGQPITADELATRMSVSADLAGQLLALLHGDNPPPASSRINGASILEAQR